MSFLLVLLGLVAPALGERSTKPRSGFHPDSLTTGTFAILCIFALTWGLLGIWTTVALIDARCPRLPYLLLLPTILFFAWSNAAFMVLIILKNIPSVYLTDGYPPLLIPAFTFLENVFNDWAVVLQFILIISIIRHRETTLRDATKGKFGGHRFVLTALHVGLASLTFVFGTAAEGLGLDTNVQYYHGNMPLRTYVHRLDIAQKLYYIYAANAAFTAFDVVLSAVILWRAFKDAAIPDKIANLTLLGIAPVYSVQSLLLVIFTIIFSPSRIKLSIANLDAIEGANLAAIIVVMLILAMSGKEADWTPGNVETVQQQDWRPESQFSTTPGLVPSSEAGYFALAQTQLPALEYGYGHGLGMQEPLASTQGSYTPSPNHHPQTPGSYNPGPQFPTGSVQHGNSDIVSIHPAIGYAYEAYVPNPQPTSPTSGSNTPRPQFPSPSVSSSSGQAHDEVIDIQPAYSYSPRPTSQVLSTFGSYSPRPQSPSSVSEQGKPPYTPQSHFVSGNNEKIRLTYTPGNSRPMSEVVSSPRFPTPSLAFSSEKNHSAFVYAAGKSRPASEVVQSSSRLPSPSLASGSGKQPNDGFFTPQSHFASPANEKQLAFNGGVEKNPPAPAYDAGDLCDA